MSGEAVIPWDNRITRHGEADPNGLLAHPLNARRHPPHQADAVAGLLGEVGWVQSVVVNERTGRIVDGHLRVALAVEREEERVPVVYVELSDDEEALVLATLDPLAAMASTDDEAMVALLSRLSADDEALSSLLADLGAAATSVPTLHELRRQHGEPDDRVFWPILSIRLDPSTHARYQELVGGLDGDEAARFAAVLDAVDEGRLLQLRTGAGV